MSFASVQSFEQCVNNCDATENCIDVSFVPPNACYKKDRLTKATDNESVWTARKQSTGTTESTDGKNSTAKALTCENKASDGVTNSSSKGTFLVECGIDYAYVSWQLC